MSVEILPVNTKTGWGSILHVGIGGDHANYGDRTPGIWFHSGSTTLHVASAVNGNSNFITNTKPLQEWNFSLFSFDHYQVKLRVLKDFNS